MKKITSIVLALIMVLSSFAVLPMTVSAAVESSTVVDSKDVKVGDTFEVNVSVANYSNVASLGFVVPGTSANLEYVGVTNNTSGPTFVETDMGNGTYAIALAGVGVADAIATANGKPITLKYKALAAGEVTLAVEVKEMLEGADGKESYSATGGVITIAEGEEEESNEPTALVYGKDITFSLGYMYDGADSIAINGNTAVITAGTKDTQDETWDNNDVALIKATGLTIPATSKFLVFGITTDVNNDSKPGARPSSTQNVQLYVDGTSVGYVNVDLTAHEGTTVYAYAVDASTLLTSGTNITLVEFDPIPNTKKGATKGDATRFGTGGSFSVGFIAAFDSLAAAEAYAAEFNATDAPAEKVEVTYMLDGRVIATQKYTPGEALVYPTEYDVPKGYEITGWNVDEGTIVEDAMTVQAFFNEVELPLAEDDVLGTFLTILKMITAKKASGTSSAGGSQAGTTAASSTPVAVYTGEQITVKPKGSIASAEAAVNAAGNVEVALPAGTGADGTRIFIVTEGADMTTPFMAVGLKITNAARDIDVFNPIVNESKRLWGANNADAGANQTFSATKIENHVVDFTAFTGGEISGGWSGVTSSDLLNGVSVNAWKYGQAFAAGTMEIAYVAFFKTFDDAKAYVHGAVAEEAPAEEPKEEVKEEEPAVSAGAILGKDLEIEWKGYWTHAGNNPSISVVGNNTVATGDSNWQNDGCAIFTIKNVAIEKGAKTLVLNIKASSNYKATPARPSTSNNIVITVGGNSKTYSFDFTNATEELTAIELDISNFENVTKLDSIQVDVFANNKVETAVGHLRGVEVIIGAIECK